MNLEARVERLERQNRRLKVVVALCVMIAGSVLLMGQRAPQATQPAVPDVVRAKRIEVVNAAGTAVVTLMGWEHGGWIETRDNGGRRLFDVSATDDGCGLLSTYNSQGQDTVALGGVKSGSGLFMIHDGKGGKLLGIGAGEDGTAVIAAYGRAGEVRALWP